MTEPETSIAPLTLQLFGPMQVQVAAQPLPPLRSRNMLWLLALLTLRHHRPVEREWLAATLWPDLDQDHAFANLRSNLSGLRSALGGQGKRLQSPNRHTLLLELTDAEVDVLRFDAMIANKQLSALEQAVGLYQGPLLEGCHEEWVFQERAAREQDCLQALQKLGDAALAAEDYATAVGYYQRAVSLDPWGEAARRGWMEALARSGDSNAALQVYREFVEGLRSDPKAVPDAQTSALYQRLRAEARQKVGTYAVVTMQPVAVPVVQGYLPHPLTDLVGREDERLEVALQLRRSRLVTLTGVGGIGKTRLAREVAGAVVGEYAEGVWLVALEALSEGSQVVRQIGSGLGLREEAGRTPLQSVTEHLRQKRLLLVLDNCEHLLEACARVVTHLLQACAQLRILATSREALGITGETAWAVPCLALPDVEHLPQANATLLRVLMGYESVQLFVERVQAVHKTFALTRSNAQAVARVCSRLEGIPLALELAAARIKAMTVEQIAARLDNELGLLTGGSRTAQSRQQTLRATLDWSYTLLSEAEALLLGRLSVFAEGWSLDAAEQVCSGSGIERGRVLDLLTSLVDKSLVAFVEREAGGRYRLLEMVRQYGAEKLEMTGNTNRIKAQHRDYFLTLAEETVPKLTEEGVWLERLEAERANLRAALNWCKAEEDGAQAGMQLAGALYRFWEISGHYSEGRAYLSEALAREGAGGRTKERARALNGAGVLGYYQGDYVVSWFLQEESLAIFRELGDRQGVARSLNDLGDVAAAQGKRDAARTLYEESLAIFQELGNRHGAASLLHHLGQIMREQGDFERARSLYEESLSLRRNLGDRESVAWSLHHLGNVAGAQGDYVVSWSLQEESLAIFRELGNPQGIAWSLNDLGNVTVAQGDHDAARGLYEESLAIFRELGNRHGAASLLHQLGRVVCQQGDYGEARALYEESLAIFRELGNQQGAGWLLSAQGRVAFEQGDCEKARAMYQEGISILNGLGDKRGIAECLEGLAAVALEQTEIQNAARLWGAAQILRESIGAPLHLNEREKHDRQVEQARAVLGEHAFAVAWAEGRALTWGQVVDYALKQEASSSHKREED
jgi:predicted ATPase/DNA-binding SARP family transcriptional activator